MKKIRLTDAFRNIKKRFISWLSIAIIVFIGTVIILGIQFTADSVESHTEKYYLDHHFKDFDLSSSMGVKKEDVEAIRSLNGIADAEGVLSMSGMLSFGGINNGLTILTLTERISVPYAVDGRMPEKSGECALSIDLSRTLGISVGDTITLTVSSDRLTDVLKDETFTVTAIAGHPDYISYGEGTYCVITQDSVDTSGLLLDYTNIVVSADIPADILAFSDRYDASVRSAWDTLKQETDRLAAEREKTIAEELDARYADAEREAREKLAEGKKKLDDGEQEFLDKITEAEEKLENGRRELEEAKETAKKELDAGAAQIREKEAEYRTGIADAEKQLAEAEATMEKELSYAKWALFDGYLTIDKNEKFLQEKEAEYQEGVERLANARRELDDGWAEYNRGVAELESRLHYAEIKAGLQELCNSGHLDQDTCDRISAMTSFDLAHALLDLYDALNEALQQKLHEAIGSDIVERLRTGLADLENGLAKLEDGERQYADGMEELKEGREKLDVGWFSLEQAKQQLADKQLEFSREEPAARKRLADAKAEFEAGKADGAKKLSDAWGTWNTKKAEAEEKLAEAEKELNDGIAEYESEKAKGEKQLEDARAEYASAEKEAEEKLAEAKAEIESAKKTACKWIVQERSANAPFTMIRSIYDVLRSFGFLIAPVYAVVLIIVCFFTITIIVEEQKTQIGTLKALGMYKSEIRGKYLLFGITGAIVGVLIGFAGAAGFEQLVLSTFRARFNFGIVSHAFRLLPIILMPLFAIVVTAFAVFWSSERLISCSAVGLISGNEPKRKTINKAKNRKGGSIYFRMILNNLVMDLGRETVFVVIVMVSILLIGTGFTIKSSYDASLDRQTKKVWQYDIKLVESDTVTDEERSCIQDAIRAYDHINVRSNGAILQTDTGQLLTEIYCIDDMEEFDRFYDVRNAAGYVPALPTDAALVTQEMAEKDGLSKGGRALMITQDLQIREIAADDNYVQYFTKCMILSSQYYRDLFGKTPRKNCYLIRVGDNDVRALADEFMTLKGVKSVSRAQGLKEQYKSLVDMFNAVVIMMIAFSMLLAFMILLNLSNILVMHRMRELLTMRVNGFSGRQVIGYLVREVVVTTGLGLIFGTAFGVPFASLVIRKMETAGFMYVRKPFPLAWIIGALVCTAFAVMINAIAFRRVNKVPLTDITKY